MPTSKACFLVYILLCILGCSKPESEPPPPGSESEVTEHAILIVVDGPRFSETWGDPSHEHIPYLAGDFLNRGSVYETFSNEGVTFTSPGHTAMVTGHYDNIDNGGLELPTHPTLFQQFLKEHPEDSNRVWIVTSKDKLEVLADSKHPDWNGKYRARTDCGVAGNGTGYRHDTITLNRVFHVLNNYKPKLMLINFREPDVAGHAGNWDGYIQGIKDTDDYIRQIMEYLDSDTTYSNTTAVFITNDHGRHLDEVADGFRSHGDACLGCRRINCFATGPSFKQGHVFSEPRELVHLAPTISQLLNIPHSFPTENVMDELWK